MISIKRRAARVLAACVLTAALGAAGSAAAACRVALLHELPMVMDGNQPLLKGEINGKPMLALVDTGAFSSVFWRGAAERYGLPVRPMRGMKIRGVGGEREAQSTFITELKLGAQPRRNVSMLVAGSNRPLGRSQIAMIIGQDILASSDVEFDFANGKIRFVKPIGCAPTDPLPYWPGEYASADIAALAPGKTEISTDVLLNGRRTRAILDTGASSTVVTLPAAGRAGVRPGGPGVEESGRSGGVGPNSVPNYVARFESLTLGEQTISKPLLRVADLFRDLRGAHTGTRVTRRPDAPEMLIGADFFRAHRVLVAYSQKRVYFSHTGGPIFQTRGPLLELDASEEEPARP